MFDHILSGVAEWCGCAMLLFARRCTMLTAGTRYHVGTRGRLTAAPASGGTLLCELAVSGC